MKDKVTFMAVDLGTSFIKAGVYDTRGNCLASAKEKVEDERPKPGVVIQKGEKLFASVVRCMKRTTEAAGEAADCIEAVSFTGQMAGFMGVDREWNDVTTWSCFIDGRFVPYANRQMQQFGRKFLEISGTNSPLMAPKIEWFSAEFPEESKRIEKYLMISGYIIGKLSDMSVEDAVMDHSFLSWTGLGDIASQTWSEELCEIAGTDRKHLPRIAASNEICGRLSEGMAKEIGLKSGIPLVSGAGDKVAGCVGAGVLSPGDTIFEAASYGAVSCMVDDYRPNYEANYYDAIPAAIQGYYAHKYIPGSGITLDWFMDTFMDGKDKKLAFEEMEQKTASVSPGCDGLMAIGLLGGNAMPFDGEIRGMWLGHTWNHKKEHFYRALLESFAFDLALTTDSISQMYPEYSNPVIKVIGGGAGSKTWLRILADVTERTFQRLDREDAALWGAVILAGNAVGVFPDMKKTAREHVSVKETVIPDPEHREIYQKRKQIYKEYAAQMHKFCVPLKE